MMSMGLSLFIYLFLYLFDVYYSKCITLYMVTILIINYVYCKMCYDDKSEKPSASLDRKKKTRR